MIQVLIENTTPILSFLTVVLNILTVLLLFVLFFPNKKFSKKIKNKIKDYLFPLALIMSLGAFVGSLVYSNVIGFIPCLLCWWERVLIYPQVILFAVAMFIKDSKVWVYSVVFSVLTIIVSGYHTYLQLAGSDSLFCVEGTVSCAEVYFLEFGYITIPTMALSVGIFMLVLALINFQIKKQNE